MLVSIGEAELDGLRAARAHARARAWAAGAAPEEGSSRERQRFDAVALDNRVSDTLVAGASAAGLRWTRMASGAAHDTAAIAGRVPSAMLFVPCRDGISHDPAEWADPADAAADVEVLLHAVAELARVRAD